VKRILLRRSPGGDRTTQKVGEAQYSFAGFTGAIVCSQHVQLRPDVKNNTSSDQLHRMSEPSVENRPLFLFMKMLGAVFSLHQNQETQD